MARYDATPHSKRSKQGHTKSKKMKATQGNARKDPAMGTKLCKESNPSNEREAIPNNLQYHGVRYQQAPNHIVNTY